MRSKFFVGVLVGMYFAALVKDSALAGELFWTARQPLDYSKVYVYTMSLDGSGLSDILPKSGEQISSGLQLDYLRNALYYLETVGSPPLQVVQLGRSRTDGSNSERIALNGVAGNILRDLALAPLRNSLFVSAAADQQGRQSIYRVDLPTLKATRIVYLPEGDSTIYELHVDERRGLLFWQSVDRMWRSDFNGADQRMILDVRGMGGINSYDVDAVTGDIFVSLAGNINRMNNRGENRTLQFRPGNTPGDLTVEAGTRKLYWIRPDRRSVERADLDGANYELVAYLAGEPSDLAIVPTPYQILLGDLDGSGRLNNLDIDAFVLALSSQSVYRQRYPAVDFQFQGDLNLDGYFDNLDVAPFAALLAGTASTVPELAAVTLAISGCLGLLLLGPRKQKHRLPLSR